MHLFSGKNVGTIAVWHAKKKLTRLSKEPTANASFFFFFFTLFTFQVENAVVVVDLYRFLLALRF